MIHKVFDLSSLTENQRRIIVDAIDRTDFPWLALQSELQLEKNKSYIPVEFEDLSRYVQIAVEQQHQHQRAEVSDEVRKTSTPHIHTGHFHVDEEGDLGHGILFRNRVLGLAWYSGRVSIDISLESEPEYAIEVFLAEGAHMIDFFYMIPNHRRDIFKIYHPDMTDEQIVAHTDHGWFEETGNNDYWSWVGESFMAGFIRAYTRLGSVQVTLDNFIHHSPVEAGKPIRKVLTPSLPEDPFGSFPVPEEPTGPEPSPEGETFFRSSSRSRVYHLTDSKHGARYTHTQTFESEIDAQTAGLRFCKVCSKLLY